MAGKIVIVILLLAVIAGGVFLFNTVSKNPVKTAGVVSSDTALGSLGWSQIPNTKLSSVCPPDAFGYSFSTKCDLVISAWGGGIADTKRNRMIIWGGGHGDYAGNEVYALDLADLKMKRLNNPSSPTSGSSPSTSDGKANSRHTYSGLAYVEHLDKMYVFSGSLYSSGVAQSDTWFLDMATLQWERVIASGPSGNYNVHAFYDPQTKKIFLGDRDSLWRFDPDLKTYTRIASYSHDLPTSSVLDPNRRIWLTIGGTYNSPNSPFVKAINVDTGATVSMNLNGCSAITTAQAPGNGDGSGPAMAYDPVADEIVAWMTGDTIWIIDLETKSCMSRTFAGGPGTPTTQGTYGRFRYFPDHDAFVIVNKPSQDAYILRLRQGDSQPSNCTAISGFASDCAGSIPVLSLTNPSVSGTNLTVTVSVAQSGTNAIYKTGYYWNQAQNQWIPFALTGTSYPGTNGSIWLTNSASKTLSMPTSAAINNMIYVATWDYVYQNNAWIGPSCSNAAGCWRLANITVPNPGTDTTAPTVSVSHSPASITTSTSVTVTATASDNVGVTNIEIFGDGLSKKICTSSPCTHPSVYSAGTHTYYATAKDSANNQGRNPASGTKSFSVSGTDTTPPVRSGGSPSGTLSAGTPSATLSLATNEAATCRYSTTANVAYSSMTNTFTTTGGTSHSRTVTGLVNGQSYNYYVRCIDAANNTNTDDFPISFSVSAEPPPASGSGIWISRQEIAALPMSGSGWNNVKSAADGSCGIPDLANQDDPTNVCIMAKALVYARTGQESYRSGVVTALRSIVNSGTYNGRALALGRELIAYPIAADLIDLKTYDPALDIQFRNKIKQLLTTSTSGGPSSLINCHEDRPNNWGTHCGGSRIAVDLYLGDTADLARAAQVFKGWLGDRSSYAGFAYGDLSWQCNSAAPVGINPKGCMKSGHSIDGVLPDDQRRCGGFSWPPCHTGYTWEGLQGAHAQAVMLGRAGYDVWNWQDKALLRAVQWLHTESNDPAGSDDTWQPHITNYYYGTSFPAPTPSSPGKNVGWTDWTHQR